MKNKVLIYAISFVSLIIIFVVAINIYNKSEKEKFSFIAKENSERFVRDYSPRLGAKEAKVFLIEFLDPECESCRRLYPDVKQILNEYQGKVQLVIRYAPFHRNSKIAVKALEAARIQGKYWDALQVLFHYQPTWGNHHNPRPELIFEYLSMLGLDIEKLREDMKRPEIEKNLNQDIEDLKQLKVRQTPTFFVNGKPLEKFGVEYLKELIRKEVQALY